MFDQFSMYMPCSPRQPSMYISEKAVQDIWKARTWSRETCHLEPTRTVELKQIGRPKGCKDRTLRHARCALPDTPVALYYLPIVRGRQALGMMVCDIDDYSRREGGGSACHGWATTAGRGTSRQGCCDIHTIEKRQMI